MSDLTARKLVGFVKTFTIRQRAVFVVLLVLMTFGAVLELASIGALFPVIKIVQDPGVLSSNERLAQLGLLLGNPSGQEFFVIILLGMLLLFVLKNLYLIALDILQYRFLSRLQGQLSARLMAGYLHRPFAFHLSANSAQLVRNVTSEVNNFFYYTLVPIASLVSEVLVVLALFILIFYLDRTAATILVAIGGSMVALFYYVFRGRMSVIGKRLQETSGKMIQLAQESLGGVKEIKVLGREEYFQKTFSQHSSLNARTLGRALVIHNFPAHVLEAIFTAIFIGLLIFLALTGRSTDATPLIGVYAAAAFRLIPSLNRIMTATSRLKQGSASLVLVAEEISTATEIEAGKPGPAMHLQTAISIEGVHFRYPGANTESLKGVTFRISKGEMVGFIGRSGSGKTTLVDCILGLLKPTAGRIVVDGRDIQENLREWRSGLGYIPQSIYLSDDSITRNVAFGIPDEEIDLDRVRTSLAGAQILDFVLELPAGLDTSIGERGIRLSGGQRQRIGIARALYRDPDILVLDEATSALDTDTEKAIVRTVSGLKGSKTILVIAHRISTLEDCDRKIQIEQGIVLEKP